MYSERWHDVDVTLASEWFSKEMAKYPQIVGSVCMDTLADQTTTTDSQRHLLHAQQLLFDPAITVILTCASSTDRFPHRHKIRATEEATYLAPNRLIKKTLLAKLAQIQLSNRFTT